MNFRFIGTLYKNSMILKSILLRIFLKIFYAIMLFYQYVKNKMKITFAQKLRIFILWNEKKNKTCTSILVNDSMVQKRLISKSHLFQLFFQFVSLCGELFDLFLKISDHILLIFVTFLKQWYGIVFWSYSLCILDVRFLFVLKKKEKTMYNKVQNTLYIWINSYIKKCNRYQSS